MSINLAETFVSVRYRVDEASLSRAKRTVTSAVDSMERGAVVEGEFDADAMDEGLDKAERKVESSAREMGKTLARWFAADKVIEQINKAIGAASDLEQSIGGSRAVFGDWAYIIDEAATGAAQSMGLSENAARMLTSQIGGLLKGFGFTQEEAAHTSVAIAQLGADLAATFGGNPEDAVAALGAALRGEFDPLERFGISLNQTQINLKAVEMGLATSTSNVDLNARAQAALALITERSGDAQGQFARETDTAAGKAAIARAEFENARAKLGEGLLPVYVRAVEVVRSLVEVFTALPGPVQTALVALVGIAAIAGPARDVAKAFGGLNTIINKLSTGGVGALGLLGGALAVGLAAYHSFSAEQRKTDENTRLATDALIQQYPALLDAARAAGDAATEIDGVALANLAIARSLSEGNRDLADAMARMNLGADDTLTILSSLTTEGDRQVTALDNLARSYGLTADQAAWYAEVGYRDSRQGQFITEEWFKRAEVLGISRDRYMDLTAATYDFFEAADNSTVQQVARDFLNAQVEAKGYEGSLVAAAEEALGFSRNTGDAMAVMRMWSQIVASTGADLDELGSSTDGAATGISGVGGAAEITRESMRGLKEASKDATGALKEVKTPGEEAADMARQLAAAEMDAAEMAAFWGVTLEEVGEAAEESGGLVDDFAKRAAAMGDEFGDAAEQAGYLKSAIDRILSPTDDLRDTTRGVWDEMAKLKALLKESRPAFDDVTKDFTTSTDAGRRMQEQMEANRDAILAHGVSMVNSGHSARAAANDIAWNTEELRQQLIAAGYTEEQVNELIRTYGLMPDQVTTYLQLAGKEEAQAGLQQHADLIAKMPRSTQLHISALIDQGAWNLVNTQLALLTQTRTVAIRAVTSGSGINNQGVKMSAYAEGGVIDRPEIARIGEAGTEVVLPKSRSRIEEILGDPRAAPITEMVRDVVGGRGNVTTHGGLSIGVINVGERRDLPAVRDSLDEAYWQWRTAGAPR